MKEEEKLDMKSILTEEFRADPIYRLAVLNGLESDLFTEGILSLHKDLSYSTVDTGKIIERSDSTIRNHFRSDLIEYIAPEKFGKYYRLNYQSIFRLHMIFLLMDKASKTTIDILAELGLQPGISMGGNIKRVVRSDSRELYDPAAQQEENEIVYEERFEKLEYAIEIQGKMLNILKYEKDIGEIERKIESHQSQISQIKSESQMKLLEEKQSQLLANSLKKSIKKQSFFGMFKKNEEIDINQIAKEIDQNIKEKYDKEIQSKISDLENDIKQFVEKKEVLLKTLQNEKDSFTNYQLENNKMLIDGK